MGTLTAGQPRLPEYCEHKLPTSCRLSSLANCCACEDERSHAAAYSVYIDGVGYVLRGSRWQRYCWFCKEFWENRVKVSGLTHAQTRIPERPDQAAFLTRWYEFHQGYRIVTRDDGSEDRVAVVGEDFRDVSPGMLPRTMQELREGRQRSAFEEQEMPVRHAPADHADAGPSLETTLDALMEDATAEETQPRTATNNIQAQAMVATGNRTREHQLRRAAALRRELQRMRSGIERIVSGLRELGEDIAMPDATDSLIEVEHHLEAYAAGTPSMRPSTNRQAGTESQPIHAASTATTLTERIEEARRAVDDARAAVTEASTARDRAVVQLEVRESAVGIAQHRLRALRHEQRANENMVRIFGTREDIIAQGDDYVSPIGGMFNSAYERFREAESTRREERILREYLQSEQAAGGEEQMQRLAEIESMEADVWGVRRPPSDRTERVSSQGIRHADTSNTTQLMEMARDEVFAGQGTGSPNFSTGAMVDSQTSTETPNFNGMNESELYLVREREQDLRFLLTKMAEQTTGRELEALGGYSRDHWLGQLDAHPQLNDELSDLLDGLLDEEDLCWRVGLPTARLARRTTALGLPRFSRGAPFNSVAEHWQDIELMATAYLISARVRDCSRIPATEQQRFIQVLHELPRRPDTRTTLRGMLMVAQTVVAAQAALQNAIEPPQAAVQDQIAAYDTERANLLAQSDTTREELERRREETRRAIDTRSPLPVVPGQPEQNLSRFDAMWHAMIETHTPDMPVEEDNDEDEAVGLDALDDGRPEPKSDEELLIKSDCRICFQQVADVICLPCGHMAMCKWCSQQHSPCHRQDATRPRRPANCPVCRKKIKQKVTVYRV